MVATTLEAAQHAASLVTAAYDAEQPTTDMADMADAPAGEPQTYARGDADQALDSAAVRMEMTYRLARNQHNALEPHATIARWDGDKLTVWDKTQWVFGTQMELATVFGMAPESVRVISPFVGGGFGSALRTWPHVVIAALAARETKRPVKLALTRRQLYFGTGFRPAYQYAVRLGSDRRGRLTAMVHDVRAETSRYETFMESVLVPGQMLYSMPNVRQAYRTVPLDVNTPLYMRGPGYTTASYVIESAMDELAHHLGIDPIELRLRNEPDADESSGLPFSTRKLRECYAVGAREFGWHRRNPQPRSTRDGDWLIGTGMAAGVYDTARNDAQASVRLDADGTALVQSAAGDMGPGTYTSQTQLAADALGLTMRNVTFRLGDSLMPPAPPHGGSWTMASVGSAVRDGCDKLRQQAIELAVADEKSPLHGADPADVVVSAGRLHVNGDPARGETCQQLLTRNERPTSNAPAGRECTLGVGDFDEVEGIHGGPASFPVDGLLDRAHDLHVAAAAADVAAHPLADLLGGAGVPFLDAADAGHDLPRRAEPALEGVLLDERPLQRMQFTVLATWGEPLDGGDLGALQAPCQRQAGVDPPPVDQDGAGPAGTGVAALLGAGQAELFAQQVQQRGPVVDRGGAPLAVHGQRDATAGGATAVPPTSIVVAMNVWRVGAGAGPSGGGSYDSGSSVDMPTLFVRFGGRSVD